MPHLSLSWVAWAVLSAIFAAMTAIFAKIGLKNWQAEPALLLRTGIVIGFLLLVISWKQNWPDWDSLDAKDAGFLVLSGLATGLSWLCYFYALQQGPASLVAPLDKLSVVFVAILSVFLLGESLNPAQWIGIGLIASGALVVSIFA